MAVVTQGRMQSDSINYNRRDDQSHESEVNGNLIKDSVTGDYPSVDNANPSPAIPFLIPISIPELSIKKLAVPALSSTLLSDAKAIGFDIEHYELRLYSKSKIGRKRRLNNSDLAANYGSLYGEPQSPLKVRLPVISKTRSDLIQFTQLLKSKAEAFSTPLKMDEWDDADRLTMQRTQMYGRFLAVPASTDLIGLQYPKRFLEIINLVAKHIIDSTERSMPKRREVMELITDAQETAVGGPSFASSGVNEFEMGYHEKRLITLMDMPPPDYSIPPEEYLGMVYQWGLNLGLPEGSMTLASAISYRQGAKGHKPQKLWFHNGSEYTATYEAMSWESNQRLVYPAPHCFNVMITPIVYQMKSFRKMKLGMFHNPELMAAYVPRLNSQGNISYESDFSSFDTTISNVIMKYAISRLAFHSTKYKWEYDLFYHYLDTTGVIFPNFISDDPGFVTYFSGAVSLLSGILPTSEIGSLISVSANLFALENQIPNIVDNWLHGKFIILVQSDDVLFTLPNKIDEEKFSDDMSKLGLTAKLKEGNMFLKKLLPVGTLSQFVGKFPVVGVPLWSRQPQQTFFNENDLDGKPDAILRLALLSRAEGLNKHPMFDKQLDQAWRDIISNYPILAPCNNFLYEGVLSLSDEDKAEVIRYSSGFEGLAWLSKIYARIDSDPKARELFQELNKLGFDLNSFEDTATSQRRSYLQAMYSTPNSDTHGSMLKILAWLGE